MGKRKNKQTESTGLSRRVLLLAGAGIAVMGSYALFGGRKEQQSLGGFLQENIFGRSGKSFTHSYYEKSHSPIGLFAESLSQDIAERVRPVLQQKYGNISDVTMNEIRTFNELDISDEKFTQFTKKLEPIVERYFRDVGLQAPKITWHRFTPATVLNQNGTINVLFTERATVDYYFGKKGEQLQKYVIVKNNFVNGEATGESLMSVEENKVMLSHKRGALLINLTANSDIKGSTLQTVNTVLAELLHYHTSPCSVTYAEKQINDIFLKNSKVITSQQIQLTINQVRAQEEGVVHAATFKWLRDTWLPTQKDVSMADIEAGVAAFTRGTIYSQLKRFYELPKTPKELVQTYMLNPETDWLR